MRTEFVQFLVQGKTGWLRRNFKQHAAGFSEINRMKVRAIDYRRDVVANIHEMFAPLELFMLVLRSKRDVMHRTRSDAAHACVGQTKQVNDSARRRLVQRSKPKSVSRFLNQTITETVGE